MPVIDIKLRHTDVFARFQEGLASVTTFLNSHPEYNLVSRKYSVFSLLRDYVDAPLKELFLKQGRTRLVKSLIPSLLGKCDHLQGLEQLIENRTHQINKERIRTGYQSDKPDYEEVRRILISCQDRIRDLARLERIEGRQGQVIFQALEALYSFIFQIRSRKPKKSLIDRYDPGKGPDVKEKAQTTRLSTRSMGYCKLCWKKTERSAAVSAENFMTSAVSRSNKYCSDHLPISSNKESWANYIRDRRYQKVFEQELALLENWKVAGSDFFPAPVQYLGWMNCLDFDEHRKLVYLLTKSRLNTEKRRKLIKLKIDRCSVPEMAQAVGISCRSVYDNLADIERKLLAIFNHEPTEASAVLQYEIDLNKHLASTDGDCLKACSDILIDRSQFFPTEKSLWSWMKGCVDSHPGRSGSRFRLVDAKEGGRR